MTGARRFAAASALAVLTVSAPAAAYRPFDGTDAAVAERGALELELGPLGLTKLARPRAALYTPSWVLNLGFAADWELVLEGHPVAGLVGGDGTREPLRVVDTGAFLKRVLREGALQGAPGPSVAVEVGPLLPELHDDGRLGLSGALIASERWQSLTTHLNLAGARGRDGRARTFAGVIVEGPESWPARPVLELSTDGEGDGARTWSALQGVVVRLSEDLSADAAVRYARIDGRPAEEARAGITCILHLWGAEPPAHSEPGSIASRLR